MNTDEIVNALQNNDNLGAESTFKNVMQQKIGDALEVKRREVANNFVKTPQVEDDEEVWWVLYSCIGERWTQKI